MSDKIILVRAKASQGEPDWNCDTEARFELEVIVDGRTLETKSCVLKPGQAKEYVVTIGESVEVVPEVPA